MMDNIENLEAAVLIRGVSKSYGNEKILDNLNVTVTKGTIYGLLGASGCGKTTLLGTIVGTRKIQKGIISILGQSPGVIPTKSMGYMPQEPALLPEFSVKNALQFQGYIFGMTDEQIRYRHQFLEELLDLPPANQLVKTLSGGQQRRLSLAMVLVHDPELLILDEPTVGLDPILRQNLWDYFVKVTAEDKKTIIITTHYLEEAREAHTIGLLRNGKILSEGEPQALLNNYDCTTIEEVFAILSRQQEEVIHQVEYQNNSNLRFFDDFLPSPEIQINKVFFTNKGHAKALLLKNTVKILRHPGLLLVAFLLPIIEISIFFLAIGVVPNDLTIGIINEELGNYPNCSAYIMDNNTIGGKVLSDNWTCVYSGLGCKFIQKLTAIPVKKYFKTKEEAIESMKKEKFHHILHFRKNYSESVTFKRNRSLIFNDEDDDSDFHNINVYRDARDLTLGLLTEKELYFTYQRFAEELATECHKNKLAESVPISFKKPIYGNYDLNYKDFGAPGALMLTILFLAVGLSVITITTERTEGMWERNIVSGIKPIEILFYHTIVTCLISFIEFIEVFILSFYIFDVKCEGSVFITYLLFCLQALVGISMGTFVSVLSPNITAATFFGLGIFTPIMVISGSVWPLEGMPLILKYFSYFVPPTMSVESLRAVMYRGWGITEFAVYKGILTSVVFTIFYTTLSMFLIKFEKK